MDFESPLHQAMFEEIEYVIFSGILYDYFEEGEIETLDKIFAEKRDEIVQKLIERLSFADDIVKIFKEYL